MYWKEGYIDQLLGRKLLDIRALFVIVETRDDTMSNYVEAEKNEMCKLKKPIEKNNNMGNETIGKSIDRTSKSS